MLKKSVQDSTSEIPRYPSGETMENVPDPDTIYTEYHPSSGRAPTLKPLHEHGHRLFPDIVPEKRPWEPFRTRLDFEILEFAMETGLNRKQLSRYINLIHRAAKLASNDDEERFTVQSAKEAMKLWDLAASRRVPVRIKLYLINIFYYGFILSILVPDRNHRAAVQA